jgi:hypothetical protein
MYQLLNLSQSEYNIKWSFWCVTYIFWIICTEEQFHFLHHMYQQGCLKKQHFPKFTNSIKNNKYSWLKGNDSISKQKISYFSQCDTIIITISKSAYKIGWAGVTGIASEQGRPSPQQPWAGDVDWCQAWVAVRTLQCTEYDGVGFVRVKCHTVETEPECKAARQAVRLEMSAEKWVGDKAMKSWVSLAYCCWQMLWALAMLATGEV